MSTQDTAALVQSVNKMTETVAGKMGEIDKRVDDAVRQIPEFDKVYYVSSNGSDSNIGTDGSPLLTITEAIDRTPVGGAVTVRLTNGDSVYFAVQNSGDSGVGSYVVKKKTVQIESKSGHGIDVPDSNDNAPKIYLNRVVLLDSAVISFGRYFFGVVLYQSRVYPLGSKPDMALVRNRYGAGGETLDMMGSLVNFAHSSFEQNYEIFAAGVKVNIRKTKIFANISGAGFIYGGVSALGVSEVFIRGNGADTFRWFSEGAISYDSSGSSVNVLVSHADLLV